MSPFQVTRAHLVRACEARQWDLLDKLLELDRSHIDDNALFTDTWGEWWGLLLECVRAGEVDGVRVLLKHGASRTEGSWGDCIPESPLEAAADKAEILALLQATTPPTYVRRTDPPLPPQVSPGDSAINRQGQIRDETGLVFPLDEEP